MFKTALLFGVVCVFASIGAQDPPQSAAYKMFIAQKQQLFESMDTNKDGTITAAEFGAYINQQHADNEAKQAELKQIWNMVDLNKDDNVKWASEVIPVLQEVWIQKSARRGD